MIGWFVLRSAGYTTQHEQQQAHIADGTLPPPPPLLPLLLRMHTCREAAAATTRAKALEDGMTAAEAEAAATAASDAFDIEHGAFPYCELHNN